MQSTTDIPPTSPAAVSQTEAQHTANSYLLTTVAPAIETGEPVLVPGDRPTWRMLARLGQREPTATVGTVEVDAQTGAVVPLTGAGSGDASPQRGADPRLVSSCPRQ